MPFELIQIPANVQGSAKEEPNKPLRGGRIACDLQLGPGEPEGILMSRELNRLSSGSRLKSWCDKTQNMPSGVGSSVDVELKPPGGNFANFKHCTPIFSTRLN